MLGRPTFLPTSSASIVRWLNVRGNSYGVRSTQRVDFYRHVTPTELLGRMGVGTRRYEFGITILE